MLLINEHISNLLYAMMEELAAEIHPSLTQISADLRRSDIGKPFWAAPFLSHYTPEWTTGQDNFSITTQLKTIVPLYLETPLCCTSSYHPNCVFLFFFFFNKLLANNRPFPCRIKGCCEHSTNTGSQSAIFQPPPLQADNKHTWLSSVCDNTRIITSLLKIRLLHFTSITATWHCCLREQKLWGSSNRKKVGESKASELFSTTSFPSISQNSNISLQAEN